MVFFTIGTISHLYTNYIEEYIQKTYLMQLKSLGSVTQDKVNLYIQQMRDKIDLFNTRLYLYNKLIEYDKSKNSDIKSIVEGILSFAYSNDEDIIDIVILDSDKKIIASKLKKITAKNKFIQNISKISNETELIFEADNIAPQLYLSAPIFKDNQLIGISIFIIKLTYLNKILTKNKMLGKTGEIFMSTKNDKNLILFTPLKFATSPQLSRTKYLNNYILEETIPKTIEKALDYRDVPVVLSLHYNTRLKSIIVVKKDIKELMQPINEIKQYQLIILFISILFIILASFLISQNIIKRIKEIVRITSNISNGKTKERIEVSTTDELGILATSVNKMADFILNAHAISEAKVKSQTKLLRESNGKLKQNNQNLSTMIKSLSHDIKTPLTIIDGYLEEIEDGLVSQNELPKVTAILKKETAYLNELTTESLNYIQSQKSTKTKETIFLKSFLDKEVYSLLRVSKEVKLQCEIDDKETIEFNATALKKILINILYNATKHTSKGSITTKVENKNIIIEDTGIGIDPKDRESIFEPFVCLDKSQNREKNGFGLGLSIAKNLADNNGYKLSLDTSYSDGCRFVIKNI